MAPRIKVREIEIASSQGSFTSFFKKFTQDSQKFDFDSLSLLRKMLSNEKAKLINTLKTKKPGSIYELSKLLNRDFKAVSEDIKVLQRFGLIEMIEEKTGKRKRLKPILVVEELIIKLKL
jgi:predicted transcriptional regulator